MRNKGSILLSALIFLAVMGFITVGLFEATVLQQKMSHNFKQACTIQREAENALRQLETRLELSEKCDFAECEWRQFVPDALYQIDVTGVSYYQIKSKNQSIYALREKNPTCRNYHAPPLDWLDWQSFASYPIIGVDPSHQGVMVYITNHTVLQAIQMIAEFPPNVIYTIDEATLLSTPTLWHGFLLIEKPLQNKLAIYDAKNGQKICEEILKPDLAFYDLPLCLRAPMVWVRRSSEQKRKIIVTRLDEIWSAEIELDYLRLRRRTAIF